MDKTSFDGLVTIRLPADLKAWLVAKGRESGELRTRLGPPPKGYAHWTLRLLARKVVELEIVETVSYETVRRTLKKNGMTNRKIQYWAVSI